MVCLDSSVVIDLLRGKVNFPEFASTLEGEVIFIPSPIIIEIVRGVYLKENLKNIKNKEKELIDSFLSSFQVLSLDKESAIKAGEIEAELKNNGTFIELEDIMIGAISICNDEKLVTKNTKHFEKISGLKLVGYRV